MHSKILTVTSAKVNGSKKRAIIKFSGLWLNEIGFSSNNLVEVISEPEKIVFKVCGEGIEAYEKTLKAMLRKKSGLLQIQKSRSNKINVPAFDVKGRWIEALGFTIGSVVLLRYEFGIITSRLIDIDKLENLQRGAFS